MIDKKSAPYLQFEKLWDGITPKGKNHSKKDTFRSRMKNSCQQEGLEFSKINSYFIFSGDSKKLDSDTRMDGEVKISKPPRRHLRKF
jgi:hypothetical protein